MGALGFANPILLVALAALPAIWWLLRVTPVSYTHLTLPTNSRV